MHSSLLTPDWPEVVMDPFYWKAVKKFYLVGQSAGNNKKTLITLPLKGNPASTKTRFPQKKSIQEAGMNLFTKQK